MTGLRTPPINDGDLFTQRVREYAREKPLGQVQILEAGCGRSKVLDLGSVECSITGVDLDLPDLRSHTRARRDLDAWHLGDLRTIPMPPRVYDIVYSDHLLERIEQAELVLDRFVAALKPGGLLLLRFRDRASAYGYLDRVLPRWLLRLLLPRGAVAAHRSKGGYNRICSAEGIRAYCLMRGLVITEEYTSIETVVDSGRTAGLLAEVCRLVAALSHGRLTAAHSQMVLVIRKPENRLARVI